MFLHDCREKCDITVALNRIKILPDPPTILEFLTRQTASKTVEISKNY